MGFLVALRPRRLTRGTSNRAGLLRDECALFEDKSARFYLYPTRVRADGPAQGDDDGRCLSANAARRCSGEACQTYSRTGLGGAGALPAGVLSSPVKNIRGHCFGLMAAMLEIYRQRKFCARRSPDERGISGRRCPAAFIRTCLFCQEKDNESRVKRLARLRRHISYWLKTNFYFAKQTCSMPFAT
jgi:hypothetical protein